MRGIRIWKPSLFSLCQVNSALAGAEGKRELAQSCGSSPEAGGQMRVAFGYLLFFQKMLIPARNVRYQWCVQKLFAQPVAGVCLLIRVCLHILVLTRLKS